MGNYPRFSRLPDRALELADSVGENLRQLAPVGAAKWFEVGAKVGALRGGARIAGVFVRRNPVVVVAVAAGAGLLWYAARQRARRVENGNGNAIEGSARRVEARRARAQSRPAAPRRRGSATPSSD